MAVGLQGGHVRCVLVEKRVELHQPQLGSPSCLPEICNIRKHKREGQASLTCPNKILTDGCEAQIHPSGEGVGGNALNRFTGRGQAGKEIGDD